MPRASLRLLAFIVASLGVAALAQQQPAPAAAPPLAATLQLQINQLRTAIASLTPDGWHGTSEDKSSFNDAQASLKRNLDEAVPGLLQAYRAAPADYGAAFRLYRDLDSISQVALSLSDGARRLAPAAEADPMAEALDGFNQALQQLGDAIESGASAQYAQLRKRQAAAATPTAPPPAPKTLVIENANGKPAAKTGPGH